MRGDRFSRSSLIGMMTEAQGLDGGVMVRKNSTNGRNGDYSGAHSNADHSEYLLRQPNIT